MIDYLGSNETLIWRALVEHVVLSLLPVALGVLVAVPIGYAAVRFNWFYAPLMNVSSLLYAIPSLALFVTLPLVIGTKVLSPINVVVALTIYTVALLVRVVADGLRSVDENVKQAATAMGYRRERRLLAIEVPIALPVMLSGLRVATVSNISLVSVGALIGIGGLGSLFTRGLQLQYVPPIVVGIVLSILLSVVCDLAIVWAQRRLTPWAQLGTGR